MKLPGTDISACDFCGKRADLVMASALTNSSHICAGCAEKATKVAVGRREADEVTRFAQERAESNPAARPLDEIGKSVAALMSAMVIQRDRERESAAKLDKIISLLEKQAA